MYSVQYSNKCLYSDWMRAVQVISNCCTSYQNLLLFFPKLIQSLLKLVKSSEDFQS